MNEKIKEFAFECARELDWDPPTEPKTYTFTEAGIEKFAELIIQECCQLIDDSTPVYSPENLQEDYCQGKLDGYHAALLEIKGHFGVEE